MSYQEFYEELAETAHEIIEEFGMPIPLKRTTGASNNPVEGTNTPGTTQNFEPKGFALNYKNSLIDGTRIQSGDKLLLLDNSVEPKMADRFTFDGAAWKPIDIIKKAPAGIPIVYFVQVRR